jgi:hypothetical protein
VSLADGAPRPLNLTRSPRLDNALRFGWESFARTLAAAGATDAATWLAGRLGDDELAEVAAPLFAGAIGDEPEEAGEALFALAELAEDTEDDLLADTLWEGVLDRAQALGDGDLIAEATRRLAALAERNGDPLAAAEYHIGFLNWRREPEHASDPEDVEQAFDEIIRLATADGAPRAAAEYAYRQVQFTKLLDADDPRAVEGDWDERAGPYASWTD